MILKSWLGFTGIGVVLSLLNNSGRVGRLIDINRSRPLFEELNVAQLSKLIAPITVDMIKCDVVTIGALHASAHLRLGGSSGNGCERLL